ncbi:MAG: polysaccharide deacetylase family protein [Promethearchaeota archaeon]
MSIIEKLGYRPSDKVVIFHIDDMGFSHSANLGAFECLDFGLASCGSIITTAPWFLEAASLYKKNPKYDIGVHLTLTCEYDLYRWRALSSVDPATGLLDSEKSLWRTMEEAIQNITPSAAESEMRMQIQRAIDAGINITHIDSHMGSVMDPKFIMIYLKLAREFKVAPFLPRVSEEELVTIGLGDKVDLYMKLFTNLEESGVPILDHLVIDTLGPQTNKIKYYCRRFSKIEPGLTHFLFHPAKMSPELQAITPDSASWRNKDYEAFTNLRLKGCAEENDLHVIGYREIRDLTYP